jgi:hypothetical protein
MKRAKYLPASCLATLLIAGTLACQPAAVLNGSTSTVSTNSASATPTSASNAAVTGIVYSSFSTDGRYVPPSSPVSVNIKDSVETEKVLATAQSDALGRFYLKDIALQGKLGSNQGQEVLVEIPEAKYKRTLKVFPGRVLNLSAIQVTLVSGSEEAKSISGTLLSPDQNPLTGTTVRDKKFPFRSVQTDSQGQFLLNVVSDELEVLVGTSSLPITISTQDVIDKKIVSVPVDNIRVITGNIKDSSNSNLFLDQVRVRVAGTNISTLTDANGNYTLNGAPLVPFTLEIEGGPSYSGKSIQIGPATTENKDKPLTQNVLLQGIGTVQVNFTVESSPGFGEPSDNPTGCSVGFNCSLFDLDGSSTTPLDQVYDNKYAVLNTLNAQVNIEGTDLKTEVDYPPAADIDLQGVDADGKVKIFPKAVKAGNFVFSVLMDKVPGGRQSVTISMTGMQTQKSISVFVPPKDTISTDLITLFRVRPAFGIGDVTGQLTVINSKGQEVTSADILNKVKIGYLDISDGVSFLSNAGERNPALIERMKTAISSDSRAIRLGSISGQTKNTYYLKNVSTGSRVLVVAGLVDGNNVLEDCFIPNDATLLNVKPGVINFAPDLTLTLRPLPGCGG